MDTPIARDVAVPSSATRLRWRGVALALAAACVGWLSLWSALHVQAAPNALTYPSAFAPCNSTLQSCINAVAAGDTLLILPNTYPIPELTIPRAMTIQGSGVVLQAAGAHRVVNIAGGQGPVTLIGLTIRNGSGAANGGGILIGNNTAVQLLNVTVRDNQSSGDGGGIYAGTGGSLQLAGTAVFNNRAPSGSGGGLRTLANRQVTAAAATFLNNSALSHGAGMHVDGTLVIIAGEITGNTVSGVSHGGGVYASSGATISGTMVTSNAAGGSGGGVYVDGPAVINNCVLTSNEASFGGGLFTSGDVTVTGCLIDGNRASTDGGGVFGNGDRTTIMSSTVRFNTAARSAGGVWAENAARVGNAAFIANQAGATGGGLHSNGGASLVDFATFTANTVGNLAVDDDEQGGGAIYQSGGALALQDVTVSNNQSQSDGGGIAARAPVTMSGGSFFANVASSSGGGLYQEPFGPASLVVAGTTWTENRASTGGGIYTYAPLVITGAEFVSNTGKAYGGGLFSNAASVLIGGRFVSNTTTITVPGSLIGGGAIYADSGSLVISGTEFINNSSAQQGGALLMTDNSPVSFAIAGATFAGNRALSGGAMEGSGPISLDGSTLSLNQAQFDGGAVAAQGPITVTSSTFQTNTAGLRGGAIFAISTLDTTADFTGYVIAASDFTSNTVLDGDGGAIYAEGPLTISSSQFAGNAAIGSSSPQGGAVHHRGSIVGGRLTAADNVYTENYAAQQGGAVYTQGGAFSRELIVNNRSGSEGGGMAVQGNAAISHTVFAGNIGRLSGALSASGQRDNAITLTVLNSLFHNNGYTQTNSFAVGAEMKVFDANLLLINNTFADPQMPPGAIFRQGVQVFRSAVQAYNNIFANYPTHGLGEGDPPPGTSTLDEDHNLFFNAPLGNFDGNIAAGGGSLTADPRFVDAANGNYRLRGDSPSVDAGLDSVLPPSLVVDLDGQPRRFDGPPLAANLVDIGAYELRKLPPVPVPGGPYTGLEGSPVALDATGSRGDAPLTFAWDCTGDGVNDVTLPTPTGATCTYPDNGSFTLRLVLTDGEPISVTAYTSATIANVAPTMSAPGDQVAQAAAAKQFGLGSFTDPGTDAPWTVAVNWGDSAPTTQFTQSSAGPIAAQTHTYVAPGEYIVTVAVTDKDNGSHSTDFRILVTAALDPVYLPLVAR
jgi:predicted outer membrane repeat protein